MKKSFVRGERAEKRAYSPIVITEGAAKTLWLAGHTGAVDDDGKSLAGDFDAQCRQTFRNIEKTLAQAGAKLADLVTMTVFLIDARHTTRMTELRTADFQQGFSRKCRDHRRGLCATGNDDRDSMRGRNCSIMATVIAADGHAAGERTEFQRKGGPQRG